MPKKNIINWPSVFPELTTQRLVLRQLQESDTSQLFKLRSDEIVNRYIVRRRQSDTGDTLKFIRKINKGITKKNWVYWAISLRDRPGLIGTICIWNFSGHRTVAEIGYELMPAYHGAGYMDEAVKVVIGFSFEVFGLDRLEAYTHRDNIRSAKLLEKNRFKLQPGRKDPDNPDNIIYCLESWNGVNV